MTTAEIIQRAVAQASGGDFAGAEATLRAALAGAPADAGLLRTLGQVRWSAGNREGAVEPLERACAASPFDTLVALDLGKALALLGRPEQAAEVYERVIGLDPMSMAAFDGLARSWLERGEFDRAWATYERAARQMPGWREPYLKWNEAAMRAGEVDEMLRAARAGMAALPQEPWMLALYVFGLMFKDGVDPAEHVELTRRLGTMTAASSPLPALPLENTREPDRRLRVAFFSYDFRYHACAFFLAGPLSRLDRDKVEVFIYATNEPDALTPSFAAMGQYRNFAKASEFDIARQARADGIDVLVDCVGWTNLRVRALCPRIAPVQIDYLGYAHTTGLPTMDYRLVDWHTDPPGAERWATETLLRMPGSYLCFTPPANTPEPRLSPALRAFAERGDASGPITFGCFNRFEKVQERTMALWARILGRTPGSVLLVKTGLQAGTRRSFERRFAAAGGDVSRVRWADYVPDPAGHLAAQHAVDIALDPFPYNGSTTTCEALLMSVPVVALAGDQHRSRVGVSLLTAAGLSELVTHGEGEYVDLAVALAQDRARLLALHERVRPAFLGSPVCDAGAYAVHFEAALREAWRAWCAGAVA